MQHLQAQAQYVVQNATAVPSSSSNYPSLETSAQSYPILEGSAQSYPTLNNSAPSYPRLDSNSSYPELAEYMGMELSRDVIAANMPEYLPENQVRAL
jgi:hypothetical protein